MAYSPEGYKLACELVIPRLLSAIESLKPGTAQSIIDAVARDASEQLEKGGNPALKDALFTAADWEKLPPPGRSERDNEIEAVAHVAFNLASETLFALDEHDPTSGVFSKALNASTISANSLHQSHPGDMTRRMQAIMDAIHAAAKESWEKRKLK